MKKSLSARINEALKKWKPQQEQPQRLHDKFSTSGSLYGDIPEEENWRHALAAGEEIPRSKEELIPALERRLRKLRQAVFSYGDQAVDEISAEIGRVKEQLLKARAEQGDSEPKGPFSGMTRKELAASRTSEPDWY